MNVQVDIQEEAVSVHILIHPGEAVQEVIQAGEAVHEAMTEVVLHPEAVDLHLVHEEDKI